MLGCDGDARWCELDSLGAMAILAGAIENIDGALLIQRLRG
jgi:hypothetical protein